MAHHRLSTIAAAAAICAALVSVAGAHAGTIWNEGINGDLSGDFNSPTQLTLSVGVNSLFAITGDSIPDPPYYEPDIEYVTIDLSNGLVLTNVYLQSYEGEDGVAWIALREGTTFGFDRESVYDHIEDMLGGAHFGPSSGDLLPIMGSGGFIPQSFVPPLAGSAYTFWIQQTGSRMAYQLDFVAIPVPETGISLGFVPAFLLIAGRRRRRAGMKTHAPRSSASPPADR
jgi:hypothetical protein